MKSNSNEIIERLIDFAARIIKLTNAMPNTNAGRHISFQILKSGTSSGANYEEACGAESRADFVHKLGVALKELKETRFWLKLIQRVELIKPQLIDPLLKECEELCRIIAKSILTAKRRQSI